MFNEFTFLLYFYVLFCLSNVLVRHFSPCFHMTMELNMMLTLPLVFPYIKVFMLPDKE